MCANEFKITPTLTPSAGKEGASSLCVQSANYRCYRCAFTRWHEIGERARAHLGNKLYTMQHKPKIDLAAHGAFILPSLHCLRGRVFTFPLAVFGKFIAAFRATVPRPRISLDCLCKTINRIFIAPPRQDDNLCGLHVKQCLDSLPLDVNSPKQLRCRQRSSRLASYHNLQIQAPLNRP